MESFNFGAFDTNLGARIAAIPQEAQKQQTANMLQAMQMQGVMNQNELAQSQMRTARRAEEGQTLLGKAYEGLDFSGASTGGVPGQSPLAAMKSQVIKSLTASNRPDLIPGELAKLTEMEHKETVNKELIGKINQQKTVAQNSEADRYRKALVNVSDYDSAVYWVRHQYNNALLKDIVSIVPLETALAEIPKDPAGLADWKNKNALGLEKYIVQNKPSITTRNTGTTTELLSSPGLGGAATVVPGSGATVTAAPQQPRQPNLAADLLIPGPNGTLVPNTALIGVKTGLRQAGAPTLTVNNEKAYGGAVAAGAAKQDLEQIARAQNLPQEFAKIDETLNILRNTDINTGLGADLFTILDRARAQVTADKKAGTRAVNTEYLDSLLGSAVFPQIQALGIGARGLDTPAERDFLRKVLTGSISLSKDTLIKMTELRRKGLENEATLFNKRVEKGEFKAFEEAARRSVEAVTVPPLFAVNRQTGARIQSTDGGETWTPVGGGT